MFLNEPKSDLMQRRPGIPHVVFAFRYAAIQPLFPLLVAFLVSPLQVDAQCAAPISSFPYFEDFEISEGGWTTGGTASDWTWGAPAKPTINAAGSGQNCWITGGLTNAYYNLGQRSFVASPCFDFTQLPHPYVRFKIWWESERQYDGANLQYSLDDGASWKNVGSINDPTDCLNDNWFNTSSVTNLNTLVNTRHGWSGSVKPTAGNCQGGNGSNGWVIAKHCMPELAGKPEVRFRFTFGAGTTCNDFDGVAFDDFTIENAASISADFSSTCVGNYRFNFTDLSYNCPYTWNWNFGDPASGASNVSTSPNPSHTFSGPGLYTVTLQASSNCSGTSTFTLPIEVQGLNITSTPPTCLGGTNGTASLQADPNWSNPSYQWNTNPPQFGATAIKLTAGTYMVSVNGPGICPLSATVLVSDPDPSLAPASNLIQAIPDTTLAPGSAVLLTGILTDPGRLSSVQWSPAIYLDCDTCLSTLATPLQTTTYTLKTTDSIGCVSSDALILRVLPGAVYIPNVIMPASDQQNSHFTVFAARDVERIELLQVYDRWGSLVFENQNFQASEPLLGWDGNIRGEAATPGVYLYVVKVLYVNGIAEWLKGDMTLIR